MITDANKLNRMVQFARLAKAKGFTPQQVDTALRDKGSSLQEVAGVIQYGPENVIKAREAVQDVKASRPKNTVTSHLLDKDALKAGVEGLLVGTERALNGATLGAYDWANTKLGGGARERAAQLVQEADEQGLGLPMRAGMIAADVGGTLKSPLFKALASGAERATANIGNKFLRGTAREALLGAGYGATRGAFDSEFDPGAVATGALVGGATGGVVPMLGGAVRGVARGAKGAISGVKKGFDKTPFVGGVLGRNAEEIAAGAQELSGALPDNGELAGTAVKALAGDLTTGVKQKAAQLYDAFENAAAGQKVVLGDNSNFMKVFREIADNTTKSGRAELNSLYNEVGHTAYDAPTHKAMKSFVSKLSEKSATGGSALSKHEYALLKEAAEKDMEAALGKDVLALKKQADEFYRNEMANPNSITNTANKLLGKTDPTSVIGNRAISSAQGKAWKASSLKKLIDEGEKAGSPYVADLKQALQANTTTRAQFNRMSPAQREMVYGDKLPMAEKNFNGGVLNTTERVANKIIDASVNPVEKILEALGKNGRAPVTAVSAIETGALLRALQNK